jgi:hypothetical protein
MTAPMLVPRFHVRQRITLAINRYEIHPVGPDGTEGPMLAFAEQKRFRLKEHVVFYRDASRRQEVFSFRARQRLDAHAEHDVLDGDGVPLGSFRKDFGRSLLRSTWHLEAPGLRAVGRERSLPVALLRRFWSRLPYVGEVWVPFVYHFDFVDAASGAPVLTSERVWAVRDRYDVTVPDPRLDFRVAASMAVALDALQSR